MNDFTAHALQHLELLENMLNDSEFAKLDYVSREQLTKERDALKAYCDLLK